jgi:hypothetical protein
VKAVVVVNVKWREASAPMELKAAVMFARQLASQGNVTQVYKLEESHYFAARFHEEPPT